MSKTGIESKCWNCKKMLTGGCNWAEYRMPVVGWVAKAGETIRVKDEESGLNIEYHSYVVLDCPEFERDKKYENYNEIAEAIHAKFGACVAHIHKDWHRYICKYEDATGEELPVWAHEREESAYEEKIRLREEAKAANKKAD